MNLQRTWWFLYVFRNVVDINLKLQPVLETYQICGKDLEQKVIKLFEEYFEEGDEFGDLQNSISKALDRLIKSNECIASEIK